jgi:hypothetical protein
MTVCSHRVDISLSNLRRDKCHLESAVDMLINVAHSYQCHLRSEDEGKFAIIARV